MRDEDPGTFWLINPRPVGHGLARRAEIPPPPTSNSQFSIFNFQFAIPFPREPGLHIDIDRGIAVEIGRASLPPYDDAYFDRYLAYEGTAISNRLGRLRTALVKKYCRTVLDIGIGCGTFLKQWAVAGCCCGPSRRGENQKQKPCDGCGQGGARRAGDGRSAASSRSNGYGYDVNPRAIAWLAERELFVDPYSYIPADIEGLCFWDSLEHLRDPCDLLARMRIGMLAFVSLPIFSELARLTESKHYRPDEHVYYFSHEGLVRFMAEQGFELLESSDAESRAGRESIESFVFRKARGPCLPHGWHRRAIGDPLAEIEPGRPLVLRTANGIGDLCWLMTLAGPLKRRLEIPKLTLELQLAGDDRDNRALEFARRFADVDEVTTSRFDIHLHPAATDAKLRYVPNGYTRTRSASEELPTARSASEAGPNARSASETPYTLIVNPWLEWHGRLEEFLRDIEPRWDVLTSGYRRDDAEIVAAAGYSRPGRLFGQARTGHICVHLCSRRDNTLAGMNRGGLWSVTHWLALLRQLRAVTNLPIYLLGARQDADYAAELMQIAAGRVPALYDACGGTSTTLAIETIRQSSLMVSFASGLAVAACYLGVPTVAFWNAEGHSISPHEEFWFSDSFATNWVPRAMLASGLYYPAVYGRDDAATVFAAIQRMFPDS